MLLNCEIALGIVYEAIYIYIVCNQYWWLVIELEIADGIFRSGPRKHFHYLVYVWLLCFTFMKKWENTQMA